MIRRLVLVLVLAILGWALFEVLTWPDVSKLATDNPRTTAFIEGRSDKSGETDLERHWVPYDEISNHLKHAVLVAEDIDFFGHNGFAVQEMKVALTQAVREGKPLRGASTISQQLTKNLWLSPSRSPWRKVKEALLTAQLERELTKRRVLELYLNVVEFGPGVFGAGRASGMYFQRPAAQLNRRQAASLAAALSRPSRWHPGSESPGYRERVNLILARMKNSDWILGVI